MLLAVVEGAARRVAQHQGGELLASDRMLPSKASRQVGRRDGNVTGIARFASQRFLNALLDHRLNGEVVADGCPAARSERFEDDVSGNLKVP